ncbi:MAG TPA: isoprenylcysteine carboxylmethyltransferase family protein [Anaerolineales bacterium]
MSALELKVPPVAVLLLFALMMWLLSTYETSLSFLLPWSRAIALFVCCAGLAIGLGGVIAFRRANTTVNPITPEATTTMVTSGLYRFSRNPMYLGLLVVLTGWAIFLSHLVAFALLPLFVLYMNRFQIIPEERVLSAKFAHQFTAYKETVRRWA